MCVLNHWFLNKSGGNDLSNNCQIIQFVLILMHVCFMYLSIRSNKIRIILGHKGREILRSCIR